ncbi:ferritin-like domain-containing protein [Flavobacterium agrisoli]|uniref:PA2169 family four-helix-bundle protein n=1 Tax=Flavobacterium agrisoli TaxID=2793066 RepID=A0A934PLG0_9FLAO|nr:PA2169 family four-helix-bundle protein [Flavobacterium agrisoli]MBK0370331.1 PA2169 family four-helix-bundle protein [Flavobacterium agrisoli]
MENTDRTNQETSTTIDQLEGLIAILEDGKLGYTNAAENVEDAQSKADFLSYARERALHITELQDEINKLGKSTNTTSGPLGAIHRTWIDFKSMVTGGDKEAIINACITGEEAAIKKYESTLEEGHFNPMLHGLVAKQLANIKNTLAKIELKKEAII